MTREQVIDNLKWLKVWLEQPPAVDWGKNYECAEALSEAIKIVEEKEENDDKR